MYFHFRLQKQPSSPEQLTLAQEGGVNSSPWEVVEVNYPHMPRASLEQQGKVHLAKET